MLGKLHESAPADSIPHLRRFAAVCRRADSAALLTAFPRSGVRRGDRRNASVREAVDSGGVRATP